MTPQNILDQINVTKLCVASGEHKTFSKYYEDRNIIKLVESDQKETSFFGSKRLDYMLGAAILVNLFSI